MVIGTNLMPTWIPNFGCGEEGNFIGCRVQQWYSTAVKTALLWNSAIVMQQGCKNSTAGRARPLVCSAETAWCFSSSLENTAFSFLWKVGSLSHKRAGLYKQKSPPLVPDCSILMQMRTPNHHSLIGPRTLSWLIRIEPLWLVESVQLWLDGESFSPIGWKRTPELLYKAWLRWQKHSAETGSFPQNLLQGVQFVWEAPVQEQLLGIWCFVLVYCPVSHWEPFLVGVFFFFFLSGFTLTFPGCWDIW